MAADFHKPQKCRFNLGRLHLVALAGFSFMTFCCLLVGHNFIMSHFPTFTVFKPQTMRSQEVTVLDRPRRSQTDGSDVGSNGTDDIYDTFRAFSSIFRRSVTIDDDDDDDQIYDIVRDDVRQIGNIVNNDMSGLRHQRGTPDESNKIIHLAAQHWSAQLRHLLRNKRQMPFPMPANWGMDDMNVKVTSVMSNVTVRQYVNITAGLSTVEIVENLLKVFIYSQESDVRIAPTRTSVDIIVRQPQITVNSSENTAVQMLTDKSEISVRINRSSDASQTQIDSTRTALYLTTKLAEVTAVAPNRSLAKIRSWSPSDDVPETIEIRSERNLTTNSRDISVYVQTQKAKTDIDLFLSTVFIRFGSIKIMISSVDNSVTVFTGHYRVQLATLMSPFSVVVSDNFLEIMSDNATVRIPAKDSENIQVKALKSFMTIRPNNSTFSYSAGSKPPNGAITNTGNNYQVVPASEIGALSNRTELEVRPDVAEIVGQLSQTQMMISMEFPKFGLISNKTNFRIMGGYPDVDVLTGNVSIQIRRVGLDADISIPSKPSIFGAPPIGFPFDLSGIKDLSWTFGPLDISAQSPPPGAKSDKPVGKGTTTKLSTSRQGNGASKKSTSKQGMGPSGNPLATNRPGSQTAKSAPTTKTGKIITIGDNNFVLEPNPATLVINGTVITFVNVSEIPNIAGKSVTTPAPGAAGNSTKPKSVSQASAPNPIRPSNSTSKSVLPTFPTNTTSRIDTRPPIIITPINQENITLFTPPPPPPSSLNLLLNGTLSGGDENTTNENMNPRSLGGLNGESTPFETTEIESETGKWSASGVISNFTERGYATEKRYSTNVIKPGGEPSTHKSLGGVTDFIITQYSVKDRPIIVGPQTNLSNSTNPSAGVEPATLGVVTFIPTDITTATDVGLFTETEILDGASEMTGVPIVAATTLLPEEHTVVIKIIKSTVEIGDAYDANITKITISGDSNLNIKNSSGFPKSSATPQHRLLTSQIPGIHFGAPTSSLVFISEAVNQNTFATKRVSPGSLNFSKPIELTLQPNKSATGSKIDSVSKSSFVTLPTLISENFTVKVGLAGFGDLLEILNRRIKSSGGSQEGDEKAPSVAAAREFLILWRGLSGWVGNSTLTVNVDTIEQMVNSDNLTTLLAASAAVAWGLRRSYENLAFLQSARLQLIRLLSNQTLNGLEALQPLYGNISAQRIVNIQKLAIDLLTSAESLSANQEDSLRMGMVEILQNETLALPFVQLLNSFRSGIIGQSGQLPSNSTVQWSPLLQVLIDLLQPGLNQDLTPDEVNRIKLTLISVLKNDSLAQPIIASIKTLTDLNTTDKSVKPTPAIPPYPGTDPTLWALLDYLSSTRQLNNETVQKIQGAVLKILIESNISWSSLYEFLKMNSSLQLPLPKDLGVSQRPISVSRNDIEALVKFLRDLGYLNDGNEQQIRETLINLTNSDAVLPLSVVLEKVGFTGDPNTQALFSRADPILQILITLLVQAKQNELMGGPGVDSTSHNVDLNPRLISALINYVAGLNKSLTNGDVKIEIPTAPAPSIDDEIYLEAIRLLQLLLKKAATAQSSASARNKSETDILLGKLSILLKIDQPDNISDDELIGLIAAALANRTSSGRTSTPMDLLGENNSSEILLRLTLTPEIRNQLRMFAQSRLGSRDWGTIRPWEREFLTLLIQGRGSATFDIAKLMEYAVIDEEMGAFAAQLLQLLNLRRNAVGRNETNVSPGSNLPRFPLPIPPLPTGNFPQDLEADYVVGGSPQTVDIAPDGTFASLSAPSEESSMLMIRVRVRRDLNTHTRAFLKRLREGLLLSYVEGKNRQLGIERILAEQRRRKSSVTLERVKRANESAESAVFSSAETLVRKSEVARLMKRNVTDGTSDIRITSLDRRKPEEVLVRFYVQSNGQVVEAAKAKQSFDYLTPEEISAHISFPVFESVQTATPAVEPVGRTMWPWWLILCIVIVALALLAAIVFAIMYCCLRKKKKRGAIKDNLDASYQQEQKPGTLPRNSSLPPTAEPIAQVPTHGHRPLPHSPTHQQHPHTQLNPTHLPYYPPPEMEYEGTYPGTSGYLPPRVADHFGRGEREAGSRRNAPQEELGTDYRNANVRSRGSTPPVPAWMTDTSDAQRIRDLIDYETHPKTRYAGPTRVTPLESKYVTSLHVPISVPPEKRATIHQAAKPDKMESFTRIIGDRFIDSKGTEWMAVNPKNKINKLKLPKTSQQKLHHPRNTDLFSEKRNPLPNNFSKLTPQNSFKFAGTKSAKRLNINNCDGPQSISSSLTSGLRDKFDALRYRLIKAQLERKTGLRRLKRKNNHRRKKKDSNEANRANQIALENEIIQGFVENEDIDFPTSYSHCGVSSGSSVISVSSTIDQMLRNEDVEVDNHEATPHNRNSIACCPNCEPKLTSRSTDYQSKTVTNIKPKDRPAGSNNHLLNQKQSYSRPSSNSIRLPSHVATLDKIDESLTDNYKNREKPNGQKFSLTNQNRRNSFAERQPYNFYGSSCVMENKRIAPSKNHQTISMNINKLQLPIQREPSNQKENKCNCEHLQSRNAKPVANSKFNSVNDSFIDEELIEEPLQNDQIQYYLENLNMSTKNFEDDLDTVETNVKMRESGRTSQNIHDFESAYEVSQINYPADNSAKRNKINSNSAENSDFQYSSSILDESMAGFRHFLRLNGMWECSISALFETGFVNRRLLPLLRTQEGQKLVKKLEIPMAQQLLLISLAKRTFSESSLELGSKGVPPCAERAGEADC